MTYELEIATAKQHADTLALRHSAAAFLYLDLAHAYVIMDENAIAAARERCIRYEIAAYDLFRPRDITKLDADGRVVFVE